MLVSYPRNAYLCGVDSHRVPDLGQTGGFSFSLFFQFIDLVAHLLYMVKAIEKFFAVNSHPSKNCNDSFSDVNFATGGCKISCRLCLTLVNSWLYSK